ncbi:putative SET domain and mariner transposase fusion [Trypoxylus dichotomus]
MTIVGHTHHWSLFKQLFTLAWEVISHSLYSPDLAPSYYSLLRALQNYLHGTTYSDDNVVMADKNQKLYERGIMKLTERWQKFPVENVWT